MAIPQNAVEHQQLPEVEITDSPENETKREAKNRPSGQYITEGNAKLVAFAGLFPGCDSEALSMLSNRQETRFAPGGELPSIKGTEQRLAKIERIGGIEKFKNPATRTTHYGITKAGIGAAWSYGYNMEHAASITGLSIERLNHYRFIAHIAAQFASPAGFFSESLGVEPVAFENLLSEKDMRVSYDPVKRQLEERKKKGQSGDFGRWRESVLKSASQAVQANKLDWENLIQARPALLTLGAPQREDTKRKLVHQPDLAINLDSQRTSSRAKNILVEVELSKKSWEAYDSILATLSAELKHGMVYDRAVYFTIGTQVGTLLRKIDNAGGYGLFASGKLSVLPITHRDGTPVELNRRVIVKGTK
ncbi:hypothetical protein ACTXJG_08335 [Glutamicibacter arilaitensis]|uniref:hypothetical protein n=1 Tax=Glutamicibacter arilaitensis TaxID=256701 RepID=UPI003FD4A441